MSLPKWIHTLLCGQKVGRVRMRQNSERYQCCVSCGMFGWEDHKPECKLFTPEQQKALKQAQQKEEHSRKQAANYLEQLQRLHGKIATLRHENNKLRKENEKLKTERKSLEEK